MDTTFKTRSGHTLKIKGVPSAKIGLVQAKVRKELRERGLPVDQPEISVKSADGREWKMLLSFDEETGQGNLDASTDAETAQRHALWDAHQAALEELQSETWQQAMQVYLALGLDFDMPDEDELGEWAEELEYLGETVPENRIERKALYTSTVVLEDDELAQVLPKIMAASQGGMVSEADKDAYFRVFYDSLAEQTRARFAAVGSALGQLDNEPASAGAPDGEGVGPDADAVGQPK